MDMSHPSSLLPLFPLVWLYRLYVFLQLGVFSALAAFTCPSGVAFSRSPFHAPDKNGAELTDVSALWILRRFG